LKKKKEKKKEKDGAFVVFYSNTDVFCNGLGYNFIDL
jgi:hypothetical protein